MENDFEIFRENYIPLYRHSVQERIPTMDEQTRPIEIVIDENFVDEPFYAMEEISPYDSAFPIKLLSGALERKREQANRIVKSVYDSVIRELSVVAQTEQAMKKGYRYVVDATESMLEAIESGKIKLTTEKNGQTFAQIRQPNGHYGSKLPIKREEFAKGIDNVQMQCRCRHYKTN